MEKTRIMEIAPDIWMLAKKADTKFFLEPLSGNIFIMRDNDLVLILDTGCHDVCQERLQEILRRFADKGAKELILMLSHGHMVHPKSKEIIHEAGYESVRFILPEPEFQTLNVLTHMLRDTDKVGRYLGADHVITDDFTVFVRRVKNFVKHHNPQYREVWKIIEAMPTEHNRMNIRAAWESVLIDILYPELNSFIVSWAEQISLESREKRSLGDVVVEGWPIGRFFAIHDASRSSGHVCIYDPLNRLMITGDATLETNPPFFDCDLEACIATCRKCLRMAEAGDILMATDCHRSSRWWSGFFSHQGLAPLDPVQLVDVARGRDACTAFYRMWVEYFSALKEETLLAHFRIGEATVPEIVEELRKSKNKNVLFKLGLAIPNVFSDPGVLVAEILAENRVLRWIDGERMLFVPSEKWNFLFDG